MGETQIPEAGVEVGNFPTPGEAELVAALLRSCGIQAQVADGGRSRRTSIGNRVFVLARDAELAKEILAAPPEPDPSLESET